MAKDVKQSGVAVDRADEFVRYALSVTKGRIRLVSLGSAVLLMISVGVIFALGVVAADHFFDGLSAGTRYWLRWVLGGIELFLLASLIVFPLWRRLNDLFISRTIEKAHPEFRNDLTDAIQLSGDKKCSARPLMAIKRRAAGELSKIEIASSVNSRRLTVSAIVLAICLAVFTLYTVVSSKSIIPSLARAMGDDSVSPPTNTKIISLLPRSGTTVMTGQKVEFSAKLKNPSGAVTIRISRDAKKTFLPDDTMTMQPSGETDEYTATWPAASNSSKAFFQLLCGDAKSDLRELIVLPEPNIRKLNLSIHWPGYTGKSVTKQESGHVRAVSGSTVTLEAETNLPISRAMLTMKKPARTIIARTEANTITAGFVVLRDSQYRIEYWLGENSEGVRSVLYDVELMEDAPPEISLTEPKGLVEIPVNDVLKLSAECSDDFGLASARLIARSSKEEKDFPLEVFSSPGKRKQTVDTTIPVKDIGQAGQKFLCWIEARDFNPNINDKTRGNVSKSETFELVIKPPDEELIAMKKARREAKKRQQEIMEQNESGGNQDEQANQDNENNENKNPERNSDTENDTENGSDNDAISELLSMADSDKKELDTMEQEFLKKNEDSGNSEDAKDSKDSKKTDGTNDAEGAEGAKDSEDTGEPKDTDGSQNTTGAEGDEDTENNGGKGENKGDGVENKDGENSQQSDTPSPSQPGQENNPPENGGQGEGQGEGEGEGEGEGQGKGQGEDEGQGEGQGQGQDDNSSGARRASGAHSSAGSDDGSAGKLDERSDGIDPGKLEFANIPLREQEQLRSIGRLISEAQNQIRNNEVSPELLKSLGMTEMQFNAFVEKYTDKFGNLIDRPDETPLPSRVERGDFKIAGDLKVKSSASADDGVKNSRGTENLSPDQIRKLGKSRAKNVSSEYRRQVDNYYRTISETNHQPKPTSQPSR